MVIEFAAGFIVFNGDKFLLLEKKGNWGFIKGKVEQAESDEEAAVREAREESGLSDLFIVKGFKKREEYFFKRGGQTVKKEVTYFLAETRKTEVKLSSEHNSYDWLPYQDAMRRLNFKQTRDVLEEAHEFLADK